MPAKEHLHFKLYKPYGLLCQMGSNDPKEKREKKFLGELYDFPEGCMAIGRLDETSEGLLLLTTDGKICDRINRSGIEKEYYAQLDGEITNTAIERLKKGVEIGFEGIKYQTKPCIVQRIEDPKHFPKADVKIRAGRHRPSSWVSITVTEGKFRQIRKMTAVVGFPTLRLVRVRIADFNLEDINLGEVKKIMIP
ncbi:MAG: pseudouridine synthase [Flavobacteriaceae bacterium]